VEGAEPLVDAAAHRLARQGRLPAAEAEASARVLLGPAGRLRDAVECGEQVDDDASGHVRLLVGDALLCDASSMRAAVDVRNGCEVRGADGPPCGGCGRSALRPTVEGCRRPRLSRAPPPRATGTRTCCWPPRY